VPRGLYLFALIEFEVQGFRERVELEPLFWRVGKGTPLNRDVSRCLLVDLIDSAEDDNDHDTDIDDDALLSAYDGIQQYIDTVRVEFVASERALASAREERRRATTLATLTARVDAARRRLAQLRSRQAPAFPLRMAEAQLSKAETARQLQESAGMGEAKSIVETRDVAVGLLKVYP
jgi:predicted DNA-binding ribbon-helix-helix protein